MSLALAPDQMTGVPTAPESRPRRSRRTDRPGTQATRSTTRPTPKSKDASMVKVSLYLNADTAKLLSIAATIRGEDQSDIAGRILAQHMPSVRGALDRLMGDRAKSDDQVMPLDSTESEA